MVTVKSIVFPQGYSSISHLQPSAEDVYRDVIGRSYANKRAIIAACKRAANDKTYRGPGGVRLQCRYIYALCRYGTDRGAEGTLKV